MLVTNVYRIERTRDCKSYNLGMNSVQHSSHKYNQSTYTYMFRHNRIDVKAINYNNRQVNFKFNQKWPGILIAGEQYGQYNAQTLYTQTSIIHTVFSDKLDNQN